MAVVNANKEGEISSGNVHTYTFPPCNVHGSSWAGAVRGPRTDGHARVSHIRSHTWFSPLSRRSRPSQTSELPLPQEARPSGVRFAARIGRRPAARLLARVATAATCRMASVRGGMEWRESHTRPRPSSIVRQSLSKTMFNE